MGGQVTHHLSIDIETFSDVDIQKAGLYKYAQSPAFEILLFAYSLDAGPVQVVDFTAGEKLPAEVVRWMLDPHCTKHAYNAAFEWYCLSRYFRLNEFGAAVSPIEWLSQWRCTMLQGMYLGYPGGLDAIGKALELPQDKQKLATGKALIRYFCKPCTPTKANGNRSRNLPQHDPGKWKLFKEYNAQDVVTEVEIGARLYSYPVPDEVQRQWELDQVINLRGVGVDMDMVTAARELDASTRAEFVREAAEITGVANPNSPGQLIGWLNQRLAPDDYEAKKRIRKEYDAKYAGYDGPGYSPTETFEQFTENRGYTVPKLPVQDLTKATVAGMLKNGDFDERARRVLEIRQELGKTSNKKYDAIDTAVCSDNRVRGLLQFYGANRTGRWAGRIVQPQNLPRTYIRGDLLPMARQMVKDHDAAGLRWMFGSVSDTLSQLIRTALVASPGNTLLDADFSAIEARVIAWLAGEEWVLEVFRTHGKIYEATASQMFNIPLEKIKKGSPEYAYRQKGKVATLALGYQGGVGAMRNMDTGHELDSMSDDEVLELVQLWRRANPNIVQLWHTVEAAATEAVRNGRRSVIQGGKLEIGRTGNGDLDFMYVRLPNGRVLYYPRPSMTQNRFGRPSISYMGQNQTTKKWERIETYGGKLVENITQATARDCLAEAVDRLEAAGYPVVFHIHDEIVVDAPPGRQDLEDMEKLMATVPRWAAGLPLNADGWANEFFKKD